MFIAGKIPNWTFLQVLVRIIFLFDSLRLVERRILTSFHIYFFSFFFRSRFLVPNHINLNLHESQSRISLWFIANLTPLMIDAGEVSTFRVFFPPSWNAIWEWLRKLKLELDVMNIEILGNTGTFPILQMDYRSDIEFVMFILNNTTKVNDWKHVNVTIYPEIGNGKFKLVVVTSIITHKNWNIFNILDSNSCDVRDSR